MTPRAKEALETLIIEFGLDHKNAGDVRMTFVGVWNYLQKHLKDGADCPGCGRNVHMDRRHLNRVMIRNVLFFYKLYKRGKPWLDVPNEGKGDLQRTKQYSTLKHWGLLESGEKRGWWRITQKGVDFVEGRVAVNQWVGVFHDTCRLVSDEMVFISDVRDDGDAAAFFSLEDAMAEVEVPEDVFSAESPPSVPFAPFRGPR